MTREVSVGFAGSDEQQRVRNPHVMRADHGSFIMLGTHTNTSRYNGICFLDLNSYRAIKVIHDMRLPEPVTSMIVGKDRTTVHTGSFRAEYFFRDRLACIGVTGNGTVRLSLDLRDLYDTRPLDRDHDVHLTGDGPYVARISSRGLSAAIVSSAPLRFSAQWQERPTSYDAERDDDASWWVLDGLEVDCEGEARIVICRPERISEAHILLSAQAWGKDPAPFKDLHWELTQESLAGLITRTPSGESAILAGLPWFFQIYARDEAIATGGLLASGKSKLAANILLRQISNILDDGRIPNRFPHSNTGSADGVGWAFMRLAELHDQHPHALTQEQWSFVQEQAARSIRRLGRSNSGVLVTNGPQETWMDTTGGTDDNRKGARIEIQALTLRTLRLLSTLDPDGGYGEKEHELRQAVRDRFYDQENAVLADGIVDDAVDHTMRPNIFLAYYVYPWLLTEQEWSGVFNTALMHLQPSWSGAVTTIDTDHPLFTPVHTGVRDRSYHRGDVWYYVNNLVAISMIRVDRDQYRGLAQDILDASIVDLLWQGAPGHCSEVSPAAHQDAFGCWQQAWSASTLLELLAEIRKDH